MTHHLPKHLLVLIITVLPIFTFAQSNLTASAANFNKY